MQDTEYSAEGLVERFWPYDGPHTSDSVKLAAGVLAGVTRYMCNALYNPQLLSGPALHRVLSSVNDTVHELDQLLDQLGTLAGTLAKDKTLYDDRRDEQFPASQTAKQIVAALADARRALAAVPRTRIQAATHLACHLGHDQVWPEPGELVFWRGKRATVLEINRADGLVRVEPLLGGGDFWASVDEVESADGPVA